MEFGRKESFLSEIELGKDYFVDVENENKDKDTQSQKENDSINYI